MNYLYSILVTIIVISLVLDYVSFYYKYSAIEVVNDMGIGYNLGNTYNYSVDLGNDSIENFEIKTWGTILPTKKTIKIIKYNGFKTIRFQVKYMNYINEISPINFEWINKIKEIVKWIINSNMYCILSIYHDKNYWLFGGKNSKNEYINLWTQIANEFKDFNRLLVFESFYESGFLCHINYLEYCYKEEFFISQIFVNIIRNSSRNNKERLLIVPGLSSELELKTFIEYSYEIKIPKDPSNKLAISLNYFFPGIGENDLEFLDEYSDNELMSLNDIEGISYFYLPNFEWGSDKDYKDIMNYFNTLKTILIDKGYPVVIGEIGIYNKHSNKNSIRQFLYSIFSISSENEGILPCLWDTSEKDEGEMKYYYNKETNEWADIMLGENLYEISKGHFIKTKNYYYKNNIETVDTITNGYLQINIGTKKVKTIILNIKILDNYLFENNDILVNIFTYDKNQNWYEIKTNKYGKKQYDGSFTYTIDTTNIECYNSIEAVTWWEFSFVALNYLMVIYEHNYNFFDYKSYKYAVLKEINKYL